MGDEEDHRRQEKIDYVSICSPNYLHDAHCRFALRSQVDAICEKPLVLNPWNIDRLAELESETGHRIWTILQLRLHPSVIALKQRVVTDPDVSFTVDLTYIISRGRWYHVSWKGDEAKSGGIATNIGVHFFDMLTYVFGPVRRSCAHLRERERAAGYLECERAKVRWFLSVDESDLPASAGATRTTYRSLQIDGTEYEFSDGFADLHTRSYEAILAGDGFGVDEVRPSIETVSVFRTLPIRPEDGDVHPLARRCLQR